MAQQGGNQNLPPSILCRMGCGFYGNPMYDGMCSKCHKDAVKRRQQTSSPTQISGRISPLAAVCSPEKVVEPVTPPRPAIRSVETASPTIPSPILGHESPILGHASPILGHGSPILGHGGILDKTKTETETEKETDSEGAVAGPAEASPSEPDKKPKKNRCHTCKKKVGLTGFACRCGGLYCGMHRYSDKHECSFNYKDLGQEEIRKSNPIVVAAKVQKI